MSLWVKICGVTSVDDALAAVSAGADAVGVNLVSSSKRRVDFTVARAIRDAVGHRAEVVAVVADLPLHELLSVRVATGVDWLQLHGAEVPETVRALLPHAYKVLHVAAAGDVATAASYPGTRLLVDTKLPGVLGGSGKTFDWRLVTRLAQERSLVLAGGLDPENVTAAVTQVRPFGVDTASGVEGSDPRKKDHAAVERFVQAAKSAAATLDTPGRVDYEPKP